MPRSFAFTIDTSVVSAYFDAAELIRQEQTQNSGSTFHRRRSFWSCHALTDAQHVAAAGCFQDSGFFSVGTLAHVSRIAACALNLVNSDKATAKLTSSPAELCKEQPVMSESSTINPSQSIENRHTSTG